MEQAQAIPPAAATARPSLTGRLRRALLLAAGLACIGLGVVGAFLPLLPTTPFILLAAACFVRSSPRMERWLMENRLCGACLRRYRNREGLPRQWKAAILAGLWASLSVSGHAAWPLGGWWLPAVLLAVGTGVTVHILRLPAAGPSQVAALPLAISQTNRSI